MPYVPSEKTDPPAQDRVQIDEIVELLADKVAGAITDNKALLLKYIDSFTTIASELAKFENSSSVGTFSLERSLAGTIHEIGKRYGYEGAFLGELNYAITRLIQRVPGILVEKGKWKEKDELRYWLYARTVAALIYASRHTEHLYLGIDGVFEDIKDEYKRRVNTAYEAAQILKSGDCYDAPYYTRLVEVADETGTVIGHMEIMLKRDKKTISQDLLDYQLVSKQKPNTKQN